VKLDEPPRLVVHLSRQNAFFDYAVRYMATLSEVPTGGTREQRINAFRKLFHPDDALLAGFREYLDEKEIQYEEGELAENASRIATLIEAELVGIVGGLPYRDRVLLENDKQVQTALESFEQAQALARRSDPVPAAATR
jgi:hypothetical protein